MDKIIQIIAICFLKSTTKGDSLNSYNFVTKVRKKVKSDQRKVRNVFSSVLEK